MKKLICVVALLALLCACMPAIGDTSTVDFDPKLAVAMDQTVDEWFSTDVNRAYLTILLGLDISSATSDIDVPKFLTNATFVGKSQYCLVVIGRTDTQLVAITFGPVLKSASYIVTNMELSDSVGDALLEAVAESTCEDGYFKNDPDVLLNCLQQLNDLVNG